MVLLPGRLINNNNIEINTTLPKSVSMHKPHQDIEIINGTYLGNEKKNYYGNSSSSKLNIKWKTFLGYGKTYISAKTGFVEWYGAGWTGQPLIVNEYDTTYLIIGAYDHNLKKINAQTGKKVWEYKFDDVIKGTGTIWENCKAEDPDKRFVILQGSRYGNQNTLRSKNVESYRAISYLSGKELWRMNVKQTQSYSRDVDGSALVINDTAFIGLENGIFTIFNPDQEYSTKTDSVCMPEIIGEKMLFSNSDVIKHGGNQVVESSPCLLNDRIYITTGGGHVFGYNTKTDSIDWDLYIGADLNSTPIVTNDNCLLIAIEKQYIKGKGGLMKIDPKKQPENSVVWFYPTSDLNYAKWQGGIIGSASVNDAYLKNKHIAAFAGIDGYLYVVDHMNIEPKKKVKGPDNTTMYNIPKLLYKYFIGPTISTPIIVDNNIIAAGYEGVYIFSYDNEMKFILSDSLAGTFESTPVAHNNNIYLASRDGYLYCFGDTSTIIEQDIAEVVIEKPVIEEISTVEIEPEIIPAEDISEIKKVPANMDSLIALVSIPKTFKNKNIANIRSKLNIAKLDIKPEEKTVENYKYHIIAGSFTIKDNAVRLTEKNKKNGFNSIMFGPINGYYFVSYYSFAEKSQAENQLRSVINNINKDSWIMKYNISY